MTKTAAIHPYHFSPLKRAVDLVLASFLLVFLSPVWGGISVIIWLTAGQPILFTQERIGLGGLKFTIYKFRTMHVGAAKLQSKLLHRNEAPTPMFKLHHDPRFVGIGQWLSNTGLDELPQLINIWRGEMSFVGPRPLPVNEATALLQQRPQWQFRHAIKPGVLSEWSLNEQRHKSLAHWQKLDALTVQRGGFWYEIQILWASATAITHWTARSITSHSMVSGITPKSRTLVK